MRNILISTFFVASMSAVPAFASDFGDQNIVNSQADQNMQLCMGSDIDAATSKTIRACTKAYKASIPNYDVKSDILTRRGWLQLSAKNYDRASRDFKSAAKLNSVNEIAYLGEGFAAMLQADYATAIAYFNDCMTHNEAAPLAYYGLGMTKELTGDKSGAFEAYSKAAKLRPDWQAPQEELSRIRA
ncbi:tetratricopeptide repeat protein [Litorimonas haliclonae]|uniref:tetratricopeptide repeat protein n=1 Tax=Litorimonas haliclonae TaxID=2081977 RepID=UPI0039EFDFFC